MPLYFRPRVLGSTQIAGRASDPSVSGHAERLRTLPDEMPDDPASFSEKRRRVFREARRRQVVAESLLTPAQRIAKCEALLQFEAETKFLRSPPRPKPPPLLRNRRA